MSILTTSLTRVRCTAATMRRAENMRKIIGRLRLGETMGYEINELLGFSPSGARKYMADLSRAEAMIVTRFIECQSKKEGIPVYVLNPDEDKVKAFIDTLHVMGVRPKPGQKREQTIDAGPGRHIHVMADDIEHHVRVPRLVIPRHTELLAFFFGLAGASL
ncbi:MAG: ArsR family transcriptional regulator [Pseudomonadota bacterium]